MVNALKETSLIPQHAERMALHNEVHARPPEMMEVPQLISHIVMVCDANQREASRAHLAQLARDHHQSAPDASSIHLRLDLGRYRLRWELHSEFVSWTFMATPSHPALDGRQPETATDRVPQDWLAALPGQCLCAMHVWTLAAQAFEDGHLLKSMLHEDSLVASQVYNGFAQVYTDFAVHADGFSRMVVLGEVAASRRLGRLVQRLLEIETYRMAALLGLPAARAAGGVLASAERELAELAGSIRGATRQSEPELLDKLTRLAGQVESQHAATYSRFSASAAYFELVDSRISDIAETRLGGVQTIAEFMQRRLTPARKTCESTARRQEALSGRISRMSNLLRTRVEIEQQQSSQQLLAAMDRRGDLQLRLQSTVEGLSVAAISYYIVGLVSYLAKGAHFLGWPWSAEGTAALAIPVVVGTVWWSLRRMHQKLFHA